MKKGFSEFGLLDFHANVAKTPDLMFSYQKVVLVDPSTLHYNYYHKFAMHPLNTEALSTHLETQFDGKILKAFYLKDLDVVNYTNSYK